MKKIMSRYQTPHKLNRLVVAPSFDQGSFDSLAVDSPFLFSMDGCFGMTFIGWDGIGYRTGLAFSKDLIHWNKFGMIMDRGAKGSMTQYNIAMTSLLRDNDLWGEGELKRVNGKYVGTWHAYPDSGYESGPAVIGIAHSSNLIEWELQETLALQPDASCAWEAGGLYKSWLLEHEEIFYLFYNAKNLSEPSWVEQTGVATSTDLINWKRSSLNPILPLGKAGHFDEIFASDPCVLQDDDRWVMFYFGLAADGHSREKIAFSSDLLHWEKIPGLLIDLGAPGSIDATHAHKPGIIVKDGVLHHFYCAVAPVKETKQGNVEVKEMRGITLAVGDPANRFLRDIDACAT